MVALLQVGGPLLGALSRATRLGRLGGVFATSTKAAKAGALVSSPGEGSQVAPAG